MKILEIKSAKEEEIKKDDFYFYKLHEQVKSELLEKDYDFIWQWVISAKEKGNQLFK